jgi:LPS export ABC transporter protein LptC
VRLILALGFLIMGCGGSDVPSEISSEGSGVEREIFGFQLEESQGGNLLWALEADYAWRIPREKKVHLQDVVILFYDRAGNQRSRLTALQGDVDEKTGIMTARQRVKLISVEGDTLTTDELNYDKDSDLISGPGFVRLAKPDRVMTGYEFEAKPDLSDYEVHKDVTITIVDRDGNPETGP